MTDWRLLCLVPCAYVTLSPGSEPHLCEARSPRPIYASGVTQKCVLESISS